jgi:hypothetical protein
MMDIISKRVMPARRRASSTPQHFDWTLDALGYWVPAFAGTTLEYEAMPTRLIKLSERAEAAYWQAARVTNVSTLQSPSLRL